MREILFRTYDKGRKEYLSDGKLFIAINKSKEPSESEIYLDVINNPNKYKERFVIEQYTGLTDKNGKNIFEGDIVNVNTNKDTLCHRYEGRNLVIRFDEYHRFVASGKLEYPLCNHYEWEVIGNIHDNPELLKGGEG